MMEEISIIKMDRVKLKSVFYEKNKKANRV